MEFSTLPITLSLFGISFLLHVGAAIFMLVQNHKRELNILFAIMAGAASIFGISLIIGSSATDPTVAYWAWFLNITNVFTVATYAHFGLRAVDQHIKYRWFILGSYAVAFILFGLALLFPHAFIPEVTPKMYFNYYLNPGPLYHLMLVYFFIVPAVTQFEFRRESKRGGEKGLRGRYFLRSSPGFAIGAIAFLLVYNIPVDPVFATPHAVGILLVGYGILSRELMDIRVVVKRAAIYAGIVAVVAGGFVALILLNNFLVEVIPGIQFWTIPLIAALVGVSLARFYWVQSIEADQLKYEFITIATHKLRTPLTRISWQTEALLEEKLTPSMRASVEDIDAANKELIEITHVLFEAAKANDSQGASMEQDVDLKELVTEALDRFKMQCEKRSITVVVDAPENVYLTVGDRSQISSVVGIFVENALVYGSEGGTVSISLTKDEVDVTFSITDDGIGISSKDQRYVFDRFFRTSKAKLADTEGLGLGLSLAKSVIKRHHGKVGVQSEGEGAGSTFWFSIPAK